MDQTTYAYVERDCVIEFEGRKFESGGASFWPCSDGYVRGIVYENARGGTVQTWHGGRIADARYGRIYRAPFCRMRSVAFVWHGVRMHGRYCPDGSQAIRVRGRL